MKKFSILILMHFGAAAYAMQEDTSQTDRVLVDIENEQKKIGEITNKIKELDKEWDSPLGPDMEKLEIDLLTKEAESEKKKDKIDGVKKRLGHWSKLLEKERDFISDAQECAKQKGVISGFSEKFLRDGEFWKNIQGEMQKTRNKYASIEEEKKGLLLYQKREMNIDLENIDSTNITREEIDTRFKNIKEKLEENEKCVNENYELLKKINATKGTIIKQPPKVLTKEEQKQLKQEIKEKEDAKKKAENMNKVRKRDRFVAWFRRLFSRNKKNSPEAIAKPTQKQN